MTFKDTKKLSELLPFWKSLNEAEKNEVAEHSELKIYKKGEKIHNGSGDCIGVIAVKSGRLRVYMLSEDGKEVTLFRLVNKDICLLSASCVINNISFDIHVDAECSTEVYIISVATYDRIAKENPQVMSFMTDIISLRFSEAMWVMEQILFMKLDKRLAMFLLNQANLENSDTITLTHEQIAGHMGSAREVISRMLKYFSNEGILKVSRKGIKILDKEKLGNRGDGP
ncbi:Crp/Fnr family transcriptional regulator [Dehalobacterium formicoaceticum]|uniref:Crp/Fnr family transcriptional regulator n=1 Tax=Dehalobacterium formicoaceticum TaxID=51515 RepID=A0ABT1XZK3_9FIRM|nr:Crp/Fnr family transcriptional regulator [Dehalobacterium formicoaceticum]MCR6544040.1 Crp/Fnr family transcriptional regulator [Dehalobacterium formicoaceticum]